MGTNGKRKFKAFSLGLTQNNDYNQSGTKKTKTEKIIENQLCPEKNMTNTNDYFRKC